MPWLHKRPEGQNLYGPVEVGVCCCSSSFRMPMRIGARSDKFIKF